MLTKVVTLLSSSQEWLLELSVVAIALFIVNHYLQNRRYYQLGSKLPGPKPLPLFGNVLDFIGNISNLHALADKIIDKHELTAIWFGPKLFVVVSNPHDAQAVYTNPNLLDAEFAKFLKPVMGTGLVTANGPEWKRGRRVIAPSFQFTSLKNYIHVYKKQSDILVDRMQTEVDKSHPFNVYLYIRKCGFDILWETIVGVETKAQEHKSEEYVILHKMMHAANSRMYKIWEHCDWIYRFSSGGKSQDLVSKLRRALVDKHIKTQIDTFDSLNENSENDTASKSSSILHHLLQNRISSNFDELRDHVITMTIAGYDTIARTTSFVLVMLALHPDVQGEAYREVKEVLGELRDRELDPEDIRRLEYLEMVIKETLRLYPVVPGTIRRAKEDLAVGKYLIPKGAAVAVNTSNIHRDPNAFQYPDKFYPEHFLPENVAKRHPYSFIGFGGGPRNCVGSKFGMWCVKVILLGLLRKYEFQCDYKRMEELRLNFDVLLRIDNGFNVRIRTRPTV